MKSIVSKVCVNLISPGLFLILLISGCKNEYNPKPRGYMRIDFPDKEYQQFDSVYPYKFQYPLYSAIEADKSVNAEPYWIDIDFPELNGKIHISYKNVENNLISLMEDSRTFAYKHAIKASAIDEKLIYEPNKDVYGILYDIKGNAASSVQFFLTDSSTNFLRGSLYFYTQPNIDSLAPIINFIREDIFYLISTFEWKN